ncbi:hypothetical protein BC939DRAFT_452030 [Gamsiella multidivaricata]|uniref:uncharacterized protein n=1 Tax=Gamsiella multidivaricata TaxID=101098 RepID=UPI00221E5D36|nr:uncharacterized protein BC939DRAFT_452030 [Gamsiella multidivaricata]KAG0366312.1 hypothetical protein BGZ54_005542 [Gamsiella multidivaricata]KAI7823174.1 hypothetical protein BC939DRAFT_452030 [Gamsiella multidivaricata]
MTATKSPSTSHTKNVFRLHGVNVLNRKNVDSIARLTALERRRATHILDERQRRDTMNQLLTELASLVRESTSEIDLTQQQSCLQSQPPQSILNSDGTEKRPPVKSNSITTLRNAIAEIRRLRACAGLQAIGRSNHTSPTPTPSRRSSSRSTSPSLCDLASLSALAELASQYGQEFDSNENSCDSSPASSPNLTTLRALSPTSTSDAPAIFSDISFGQLYSPPLSPSSPSSQTNFSIALPVMNATYTNTGQTQILPPLSSIVQSACITPYNYQHQQAHPAQPIFCTTQYEPTSSSSSTSPGNSESLSSTVCFPEPSIAHSSHFSSTYQSSSSFPPL